MFNIHNSKEQPDFSLVLGGPMFQLLMRLHLTTPALDLLKRRIIFITLFAWLPLLFLSLLEGKAWGGIGLPFLYDMEVQIRFLVALPLFISAELLVHRRLRDVVGQFVDRDIIPEEVLPKFRRLIASAMELRNSMVAELILFVLIFVGGHYLWSSVSIMGKIATGTGTWYAIADGTGIHLSSAGYWYIFISRPLFQFIGFRWYYRIFIWIRFLWQSSRLQLNLVPTHPDRAAGLGFLSLSSIAFAPLLMAHGALLTGIIADPILFAGEKLSDFLVLIIGIVVFLLVLVLGPPLVFLPKLFRAKREGLREYGMLASKYVNQFDLKWVRGGAANGELLIGTSDIQSLADIGNSFQVIREIRPYLFGKEVVIQLVVIILLPVLPLVLTMIPLEQLIWNIIGLFI